MRGVYCEMSESGAPPEVALLPNAHNEPFPRIANLASQETIAVAPPAECVLSVQDTILVATPAVRVLATDASAKSLGNALLSSQSLGTSADGLGKLLALSGYLGAPNQTTPHTVVAATRALIVWIRSPQQSGAGWNNEPLQRIAVTRYPT